MASGSLAGLLADALLMTILPQTLLALVRRDLLALPLLPRAHPDSFPVRRSRGRSGDRAAGRYGRGLEDLGLEFLARLEYRHQNDD